jgi:cytochrome P450
MTRASDQPATPSTADPAPRTNVASDPDGDRQALEDPWRGWNPFDPTNDPDEMYSGLARLRRIDPVNLMPIGLWRLTRYADVVRLLKDVPAGIRKTDGMSYRPTATSPTDPRDEFMLLQDPPAHTRLRKLVSRAFTPRAVERTRASIERIAGECLDRVAARGEMDAIADLALPVPSTVICEMLGVPVADRPRFTQWTAEATHALTPNPIAPPELLARADRAAEALWTYFDALIAERRLDLGDDLVSGLIRAEVEGDRLTTSEMMSQSIGLLIAGFETTIGLIGNGVRALLQHPDQLAKLRASPELIDGAIEECLRYDGPIVATLRVLHDDVEFGGKLIPRDAIVIAVVAAANRDPERFENPDAFDIERPNNEHLAFGGGVHHCLGAHLARLEARIAIGALVSRFDDLVPVPGKMKWGRSAFRVPGRLSVTFTAG